MFIILPIVKKKVYGQSFYKWIVTLAKIKCLSLMSKDFEKFNFVGKLITIYFS